MHNFITKQELLEFGRRREIREVLNSYNWGPESSRLVRIFIDGPGSITLDLLTTPSITYKSVLSLAQMGSWDAA
jgi:hypothetical protein